MQTRVNVTDRIARWAAGVGLLVLLLACYWPALTGTPVWDDAAHLTRPDLQTWAGLRRIWFVLGATQQYYPILHSAFWLEHRLWGDAVAGYHLLNVGLHAAACALLVVFLRRFRATLPDPRRLPAGTEWLAALIFAVHPVMVESVAWISEQKNTLSLVFYLLAALAYLRFDAKRRGRDYAIASIFFLLALGTKTVTASLPAALLVLLWWRSGALGWRRDVQPLVPWFAVALAAGLFTAWVERRYVGAEGAAFDLSAVQRAMLAGRVVWFYLGKLFWPTDLIFIYRHWDIAAAAAHWGGYLAGALAVTAGWWALRRRTRGPLAGWLFFTGSLFPALGFVNVYPFRFSYVADHFQYLASLGVIVTVAAAIAGGLARAPAAGRIAGWLGVAALVAGLAGLSHRQSGEYRDSETLYRATLAANPDCWMAHNNLAVALEKQPGGIPEAIAHYKTALRLKPDYAYADNNYGNLLAKLPGREAEAEAHLRRALQIYPDFIEAQLNLANLLVRRGGTDGMKEALALFARAAVLEPNAAAVHESLAEALARIPGREAEAKAHYEVALRLDPKLAAAHYNLGVLYDRPGGEQAAAAEYEAALRLKPDYAAAHNNLGTLLASQGHLAEAEAQWEAALRADPNYEDARANLEMLRRLRQKRAAP